MEGLNAIALLLGWFLIATIGAIGVFIGAVFAWRGLMEQIYLAGQRISRRRRAKDNRP
jgi:hypothetical protein